MSYGFLLDIGLILLTTKVFSIFAKRIKMPQVVGAIVAGVLFGPAALGILHSTDFLSQLAELGVIVLMFNAGLETDLVELKQAGKSGFIVAMTGVIVPLAMGFGFGVLFNGYGTSQQLIENVFIGVVLTATSVSITVETLKELGRLSTKTGNTILAAALIDDILGLILLTLADSITDGSVSGIIIVMLKILAFLVICLVLGTLTHKFLIWYSARRDDANLRRFPVMAFVVCLLMSFMAVRVFDVAAIIGAFVAGLAMSGTNQASYIQSRFDPLSYLLLTPIFFASIGLNVDLGAMDGRMIFATVVLIIISIVSKILGCGAGSLMTGLNKREALQVGVGMSTRGEVSLIVASSALAKGVLPSTFFSSIVIMVVLTSILTPIMLKMAYKNEDKYANLEESRISSRRDILEQAELISHKLMQHEHDRMISERDEERKSSKSKDYDDEEN